jgi:hypothetical protein
VTSAIGRLAEAQIDAVSDGGEPEIANRAERDREGTDAQPELGDDARGRDPSDAAARVDDGLGFGSVNQRFLSWPGVMGRGLFAPHGATRATAPAVVMPTMRLSPLAVVSRSVNQRLPSGPEVIPSESEREPAVGNGVIAPAVVISPTLFAPPAVYSVNHRLPSGPDAIMAG